MIQVEQREYLIVEFAGEAPEDDRVTIIRSIHNFIKPFFNIGFVTDLNFMDRSIRVVVIKMFSETMQAHLADFGNGVFFEVTDHQRGNKVLSSKTGVHDEDGYTIDCREDCANDIYKEFPVVIITESEEGLGLPNEQTVPHGPQLPVDIGSLNDREVIVHADEA